MRVVGRTVISATVAGFWMLGGGLLFAQEEAARTHEVRRGDTLWDLAARYLANPLRWPEIHRLNPGVVEDPHWIFPGEVLRLPGAVPPAGGDVPSGAEQAVVVARRVGRNESFGAPSIFDRNPTDSVASGALAFDAASRRTVVSRSDFYRVAFLAHEEEIGPIGSTARLFEENPLRLNLPRGVRENDRVLLDLGGAPAAVGDVYQAIRWGRGIAPYGRIAHSVALLALTDVAGDTARAVVIQIFGAYKVGDPVIPATAYEVVAGELPEPLENGMAARVIGFETPQPIIAPGDAVFLDVGATAGVRVGDEFAVFSKSVANGKVARLDDRLCTVRVALVRERTSTGLVVSLREAGVEVGAPARMVRQMPGQGD
ncbi:MAG: LysM peptidoglycan-binding domain-containing protein [Gemmatimonadota bacterium]